MDRAELIARVEQGIDISSTELMHHARSVKLLSVILEQLQRGHTPDPASMTMLEHTLDTQRMMAEAVERIRVERLADSIAKNIREGLRP